MPTVDAPLLDEGGTLIRGSPLVIGAMPDGSLVAYLLRFDPNSPAGLHRTSNPIVRFDPRSAQWISMGASTGVSAIGVGRGATVSELPAPASGRGIAVVSRDRVVHGWSDEEVLHVVDGAGAVQVRFQFGLEGPPVTPQERSRLTEAAALRQPPNRRTLVERALNDFVWPERWPAWRSLAGLGESVWIEWTHPHPEVSRWSAFSVDGAFEGAYALPRGFRPTDGGSAGLVGILMARSGEASAVRLRFVR